MEYKALFKVGDKVTIRKREGPENAYPCTFVDQMTKYAGETYTISQVLMTSEPYNHTNPEKYKYPSDGYKYYLKEISWTWSSAMFEQPKQIKINKKQIKLNYSL